MIRWLRDLFKIGLAKEINEDDLYKVSNNHDSRKVSKKFEMLWEKETLKESPSLVKVTLKCFWYKVMVVGFFFSVFDAACK